MNRNLLIIISIFMVLLTVGSALAADGFLVLSAGKASYVSNDQSLGGSAWLVTVSQNGGGQSLVGTFSPDQFVDTSAGIGAKYPLTISTAPKSEQIAWQLKTTGKTISDTQVQQINTLILPYTFQSLSTMSANCQAAHQGSDTIFSKAPLSAYAYCIWYDNNRPLAEVSPVSQQSFTATVTVTSNGNAQSADISNSQTSANIGSVAQVSWAGSLSSGTSITFPSNALFAWNPGVGSWQTIDRTNEQTYFAAKQNLGTCLTTVGGLSGQQCVDQVNAAKNVALSGTSVSIPQAISKQLTGSLSNGQYVISINQPLSYPVLTFKIRADYLGIVQLVGIPKIASFGAISTFSTGSPLNEQVNVRNVGAYQGTFDVFAVCQAPLSSSGRSRITVPAGQMGTAYLTITGATSTEVHPSCTFTAVDVNNPSNIDVSTKSYDLKTLIVCTPDEQRCNGQVIEKCAADGSKFVPIQTCATTCKVDSNVGSCQGACTTGQTICLDGLQQSCNSDRTAFTPVVPNIACTGGATCQSSFFGLVQAQTGQVAQCGFLCKIGITSPQTVTTCVNDYTPLWIVLATIFLVAIIGITKKATATKKSKKVAGSLMLEVVKSKWFWIGIAILVGFAAIMNYFAYVFWSLIIILTLGLLYVIIFGGSPVGRAVRTLFRRK